MADAAKDCERGKVAKYRAFQFMILIPAGEISANIEICYAGNQINPGFLPMITHPLIENLGLMPYRQAWQVQQDNHTRVLAGETERILLVEHPPVITLGRRPDNMRHLLASSAQLAKLGVELVESDRGGDITFHGPGQIVAYPIIRLADHHLSISGYVHHLEKTVIAALAEISIEGHTDPAAVGVWVRHKNTTAKICAIGVRIRRGISLHGLALNVTTDLSWFDLIVPCGIADRRPISIQQVLGGTPVDQAAILNVLQRHLLAAFSGA